MSLHPLHNYFTEFPNSVFIETGSYRGDGIQAAIEAGFEKIHSVELSHENYQHCIDRFDVANAKYPGLILYNMNSVEGLKIILHELNEPATFWLDAHSQLLDTDEFESYPLIEELEVIGQHHIKTHTIIIDDILHLTHPDITGWTKRKIEAEIKAINENYKIQYRSNPVINNILIASL